MDKTLEWTNLSVLESSAVAFIIWCKKARGDTVPVPIFFFLWDAPFFSVDCCCCCRLVSVAQRNLTLKCSTIFFMHPMKCFMRRMFPGTGSFTTSSEGKRIGRYIPESIGFCTRLSYSSFSGTGMLLLLLLLLSSLFISASSEEEPPRLCCCCCCNRCCCCFCFCSRDKRDISDDNLSRDRVACSRSCRFTVALSASRHAASMLCA
mmetsp:Transcript_23150/g.48953  ORF Transcript_23150/g.48953 Transcript_23150/m.48953 type:complete len:206 (+) Transcript_23150:264-881(+)